MRQHLVILTHRNDDFDHTPYFLGAMAQLWREQGWRITVQRGPAPPVDADLAFLHVDLTVVHPDYVAAARQYPRVLNGCVLDISKRAISRNLVVPGDGYTGPVIVKTNGNSGARRELALDRAGEPWVRVCTAIRRRMPWWWRAQLPVNRYPIFDSVDRVPVLAWHNRDLVIERFITERRDNLYALRTWVFMGDCETHSLFLSPHPVVKSGPDSRREVLPGVPDDLRQRRREMGFDFGKFDYGVVDGRVILYDANRTPMLGNYRPEQYMPRIRVLAEGLRSLV